MPISLSDFLPYISYATPPVIGAFIGYLTNRVAIRMLFRPLKKWRIGPVPLPMTPGVIPSKRHDLAVNIGEMVGEHLLTSEEINNSLQRQAFQEHLHTLIETKVGTLFKQDLGPLTSLIAPAYKSYFDIGIKTISYQTKKTVQHHIRSAEFACVLEQSIGAWLETLLDNDINTFVSPAQRLSAYRFLEKQIERLIAHEVIDDWVRATVARNVARILESRRTTADILPPSLQRFILGAIHTQTPFLLNQAAAIIKDPEIQEKIINGVKQAITEFITTLGPMASMVQGFINMEMVEQKVREYLREKEDDIVKMLLNEDVKARISVALTEGVEHLMRQPLADLVADLDEDSIDTFTNEVSRLLVSFLREAEVGRQLGTMMADQIENQLDHGENQIGVLAELVLGTQGVADAKTWLQREAVAMLDSPTIKVLLDDMIETMLTKLIGTPIGRLDHLIPAGVRGGLYRSLREMATTMLTSEVPGVVKSLNVRKIVTDKIDSFDLLRLESLLLSIMDDQFKYINLFGALLGFLIGCANVIVLIWL